MDLKLESMIPHLFLPRRLPTSTDPKSLQLVESNILKLLRQTITKVRYATTTAASVQPALDQILYTARVWDNLNGGIHLDPNQL